MSRQHDDIDDLQATLGTARAALHGAWTLLVGFGLLLASIASFASSDPSDDFLVAAALPAVVLVGTSHRRFSSAIGRSRDSRMRAWSETFLYVAVVFAAGALLFVLVER